MPRSIVHRRRLPHVHALLRRSITYAVLATLTLPPLVAPLAAQTTGPAAPDARPAGPASLEGLPILRVEVVGNVHTDSRLILDQVRAQPGQPYSRQQIDVDTRSIAALDRFVTVTPFVIPQADPTTHLLKGVVVRFQVEERPIVAAVEIRGNREFTDTAIRDVIATHVAGAIDPFTIQTDVKSILDMYRNKGYAQTTVDVDPQAQKQGIVRYSITEGPRARITSIRFDGNANVNSDYLKFKIQTHTSFWFFRKGVLDEDKLQQDLVTIRDIYEKRGFLDARISYFLDYSNDKSEIALRFAIVEGPRYKIGKIFVTGNTLFPTTELLFSSARFGPGAFAQRDEIEALQKRIEDKYGHEGYINREVAVTHAYTDVPGVVDLHIAIIEGNPFIVGRIIIRGNPNVQDRVIRRQIRIYPDQTYDTVLVRKSIERLKSIRIFQDVRITPMGDAQGVRDALVEVAEGQTGRFLIGAGVSTDAGLIGQISLEQQNFDIFNFPHSLDEFVRGQSFKGAGQYFRILLEPGTEFQQYRVTFEEPYLFDTPYSFSNDVYYFTRARESWNERRIGDIVTFGRRFGDVWGATLAFRAEQVSISSVQDNNNNGITDANYFLTDPTTGQPVGPYSDTAQEIIDNKGSHFLTTIKPGITRDTTDSRIFPTTGSRSSFAIEQYGPMGGDITATKFILRFDKYFPLFEDLFERKTVLALRNEVGLAPFGNLPFYERFYAGGIGSLRGFKFRGVGPHDGPLEDPTGGDLSWVSTAEVNYPIWENILRGVVFVDVGNVERDITIGTIRSDIGAGVRVTIPFFGQLPLALDFAIPVTKQAHDRTQIISFALGIPF